MTAFSGRAEWRKAGVVFVVCRISGSDKDMVSPDKYGAHRAEKDREKRREQSLPMAIEFW